MPLHSDAFRQECLFAHVLFHRDFFDTAYPLHTEASTHRTTLTQRGFCTEIRLYRGAFQTQIVHRYIFYKEVFFDRYFYTEIPLHTGALGCF